MLIHGTDGVGFHPASSHEQRQAAVTQALAGACFAALDYERFQYLLYDAEPGNPDDPPILFAATLTPFPPARRALYKSVRIAHGEATYMFEPVFVDTPDGPRPAALAFDEFVADLWHKGVRCGIDAAAVRAGIASGKPLRCVVACRREAVPGQDAVIVEATAALHRSNAPRELANGRVDLHTFENRFPQVEARTRLLRKVPATPGRRGVELSGAWIEPALPRDVELATVAGAGTVIEHLDGNDWLVAAVQGFVNVDRRSGRIAIGPKIVSRDGVSVRTTGNLQLAGEYEEFGEVQENRVVEGGGITIHGDVFGRIVSRGGTITLRRNLVGGAATSADGAIRVGGVAANAVLQTRCGEVTVQRAQNCVITGTRVRIGHATNCEIMADEVVIKSASGCAIAARSIVIDSAGPRNHDEMTLFALQADTSRLDGIIADRTARTEAFGRLARRHLDAVAGLAQRHDVRTYLALAPRVQRREVALDAVQLQAFRRIAAQVAPVLREISQLTLAARQAGAQQALIREQAQAAQRDKDALGAAAACKVRLLAGETVVRTLPYDPDRGVPYDVPAREVRHRLRALAHARAAVGGGSSGPLEWPASS
ncbi:flagellar assembly protein A [Pseudoduganella chitinolytica]|uniref:FapA family protein n=1 Tax=Pseudoduganella chitinolytica TaxID=34070 RepID=A0ABY8BCT0_9BURK|nr:flagellar assembly protein A [Pseudoduganella chitinolytica]WEF33717.1 FapA family protein [Pseudoduganella chitinolytica]